MKAVVVIDMPENCRLCPFRQSPWSFCLGEYEKEKHCPLRPLPQKKNTSKLQGFGNSQIVWTDRTIYQNEGWNDCLKEITGETE